MEENKTQSTENEESNKFVKTYAEDMARVLENDKEGLVKKIIHGEEAHEAEKRNLSPESKKNKIFMLTSFLLIFIALCVLSYFFLVKEEIKTVAVEQQFTPIIFNDKTTFFEILGFSKDEIIQTVVNQANITKTNVKIGGIEGVYLTESKKIIGFRRFLALIKSNFAPNKDALLVSDNFLIGLVNTDVGSFSPPEWSGPGGDFFILLKVRSTADIFESMRAWEAKMFSDLYKFLDVNLSDDTKYLLTKNFEDEVVENKNARILYNKQGGIALMYIFADDNSVIITNSRPAAHEIMLRLASAEKKQ